MPFWVVQSRFFRWRPWRPQHPFLRSTRIFGLMRRSRSFGSLGRITGRFENQSFNARWDEYPRRWTRNSNSDPKSPLCWTTNIDQHSDGCFLWCLKTKLYNMYIYICIYTYSIQTLVDELDYTGFHENLFSSFWGWSLGSHLGHWGLPLRMNRRPNHAVWWHFAWVWKSEMFVTNNDGHWSASVSNTTVTGIFSRLKPRRIAGVNNGEENDVNWLGSTNINK